MEDEKWNVLVIDDEVKVLTSLKRSLGEDFNVHTEQTFDDALECLRSNDIDVVICDYRLEESRTGIDLFEELLSRGVHTINILLTGQADVQMGIDAVNRVSLYRIILKPWDDAQLIELLQSALQKREVLRKRPVTMDELKQLDDRF